MANNDKITVEIKSDFSELSKQIENFSKKIGEIYQIFDSTLSKPISTFEKIKTSFANTASSIEKVNSMAKQGSEAFKLLKTGLEISTESGLKGYKKLETAIALATDKTKLATIASKVFNSVFSFGGIAMITAGIIGLSVAFVEMCDKETKSVKAAKENLQAMKQQKDQYKEMQQASQDTLKTSMVEIDLTQRYSKELLGLVDSNGVVIGSQERVNFLINQLNDLLPDAGFHFDEETGKIVDMNGEAVNLTDTLKDLIEAQKAQAYLDAYQDDYSEALKNKNDLMERQMALYEEINKKQAIADQFTERAAEAREKFGLGTEEYNNYMEEFYKSVGMSAGEMKPLFDELKILNQEYEEGQVVLKGYTDQIKDFEAIQEAIANHDWDKVNEIMNGMGEMQLFDPIKGQEQIEGLKQQYEELSKTKQMLEDMRAKGDVVDEEYLQNITDQTEKAQEELEKSLDFYSDKRHTYFSEEMNLMGDEFKETITEKTGEAGASMAEQMKTDAKTGIDGINTVIASTPMNAVTIPVVYQSMNNPYEAYGATVSMIGASYDDFIENPSMLTPFSSDASYFMAQARNTMQSLQSRLARGIVSMPVFETKLVGAGNKQVDVNQTNVFNVPVQKPSDVTRAIEKMNRELAKRL